jgi:hypothetical protein
MRLIFKDNSFFFISIIITSLVYYFAAIFLGLGIAPKILMVVFSFFLLKYIFSGSSKSLFYLIGYLVVLLPIINFTKGGFFSYNVITVLLALILIVIFIKDGHYFRRGKPSSFYWFVFICVIYYLFSCINVGKYDSNLRFFELLFTALLIPKLWEERKIFIGSIFALSINSIFFTLFLLNIAGSDTRLMLDSATLLEEGIEIGGNNPISYGLPISFCIIMVYTYFREQKLLNTRVLIVLLSFLGLSLFLTTSRGSILIVILCVNYYFLLVKNLKAISIFVLISSMLAIGLFYLAQFNDDIAFAYDFLINRTASDDDLNKISHGRTEQWSAMWEYAGNHFQDLILGYGPGRQFEAHEVISQSLIGVADANLIGTKIAFHALPLQIISELGIIGTFIFYFFAFRLFYLNIISFKYTNFALPLIGFLGWFSAGLSVSSLDPFSGLFLGLSIIPFFEKNKNYVRF